MYTKSPIKFINKCVGHIYNKALSIIYNRQYKQTFNKLKPTLKVSVTKKEEREYIKKWKVLGHVNPIYFKLFANYVSKDLRIVPEDIAHNAIEPLLNPIEHRGPYADKNMYDKIFYNIPNCLAKTYIRRIGGHYYDCMYKNIDFDQTEMNKLKSLNGIVAKVTIDTSSGLGVKLFGKKDGVLLDKMNNVPLSKSYLEELGNDFIVQEYLSQSEFMSFFNTTSINTLRMLVYRSVKDNKVYVLNTIMRIGKNGSLLDNAHQGGAFIGVKSNGELQNFLVDQFGNQFSVFNGINFKTSTFTIPNWDSIVDFATKIGENVMYHRLLSLDVMIDENNIPRLIEYNIRGTSVWLYQYTIGACFGDYTKEIIDYCTEKKKDIKSEYLLL